MLDKIESPHFLLIINLNILLLVFFFFPNFGCSYHTDHAKLKDSEEQVPTWVGIGVVRDLNSPFGMMISLCLDMAVSDFYSAHPHYRTRLRLRKKVAKSVLDFNLAVLELAKSEEVVGVIGPQGSSDDAFAASVGESARVPIVSFTARSSDPSYAQNAYFVRTTLDDAVQAQALAALCGGFKWSEAVILYEDAGYGHRFLSHVIEAFQGVDIGLAQMISIPTLATDSHILEELNQLNLKKTKVFVVHMNFVLGYRLLELAGTAGMMREGYAWIITDSLSIFSNSIYFDTRGSMDGVLALQPHVYHSKSLLSFKRRWKRNALANKSISPLMELNIYGLWAYDAITALARAVEEITLENADSSYTYMARNGRDEIDSRDSSFGPTLIRKLSSARFRGFTGDFQLIKGTLKPSAFEIINIIGTGKRRVGFWTPERGIVREVSISGDPSYSNSTKRLRTIMWPGDTITPPMGWNIPPNGKLRVGIPWKPGFKEFVDVAINRNHTNAIGFSIDIFLAALKVLPFPVNYEFYCYNDSSEGGLSYTRMLQMIPRKYDMVVGDTTIWAPRTKYVDFSLPYSESGVVLVVKNTKPADMWTFIKPLRWDLWLAIIVACIFVGVVLHILERRVKGNDEESAKPHLEGHRFNYWSPIAILAFPERNAVRNNWSVFILVCWLFMAFILMQSFTANLSAILTVNQLKFAFSEDYYVGYHDASFMKDFLVEELHLRQSRLRPYASVEEFHEAMSKGSKHGGIDAIFDEIPYMKLFLNRYESQYKIVGPTYRTDGLGFAFPIGSPLVAYFSRAILNVTQGPEMNHLERKNFGPGFSSQDPLSSAISQGTSSLTLEEFAGLFLTTGSLILLALFCSETSVGRKMTQKAGHFMQNIFCWQVHSKACVSVHEDTTNGGRNDSCKLDLEDNANYGPTREEDKVERFISNSMPHDGDEIDVAAMKNEVIVAQDDNQGLRNSK